MVYLSHVCNGAGIVSLERSHDAEGRGDDVDEAIGSTDEEVRGAGADTGEVTLGVAVRYVVGWRSGKSRPYIED
jgi:hypothetical protein